MKKIILIRQYNNVPQPVFFKTSLRKKKKERSLTVVIINSITQRPQP